MPKSLIRSLANMTHTIPFQSPNIGRGGILTGGPSDKLAQIQALGSTGTLYSIVQLLSTGVSAHSWSMYQKQIDGRRRYARTDVGSDQRPEVTVHPALDLWNRPNDFWDGEEFREMGWQYMELVGEWYWVLNRGPSGKGVPLEMWTVRPDRMEPVPSKEEFLAGWLYTGPNGEVVPLDTSEVIQLRYPHPSDFYRGMSAVQSLLADIDSARFSAQWSRNFFMNSAVPGGIVQFAKRLSEPEYKEFVGRWRDQHQGIARGHRVGILEQGATWYPNTYTIRDMQFAELRNMSREVIREAYRIHPAMLGLVIDVNRANAETAEEIHVAWHEVPRLRRMRSVLNHKLLPMYGDKRNEFDFNDPAGAPSPENAIMELQGKANAWSVMVKAGAEPHAALEVCGLPDMEMVSDSAPAPAARPALGNGDVTNQTGGDLTQGQQNYLYDLDDPQVLAVAMMIRDAFKLRASNGRRKELVAGSTYE